MLGEPQEHQSLGPEEDKTTVALGPNKMRERQILDSEEDKKLCSLWLPRKMRTHWAHTRSWAATDFFDFLNTGTLAHRRGHWAEDPTHLTPSP